MTSDAASRTEPPRVESIVAAPGDVIELSGIFGGGAFVRLRDVVSRGLVVNLTGVTLLVVGAWRPAVAPRLVFDVERFEPWAIAPPRTPRRPRIARREAQG